ncbi:hypothetical protein KVT40_003236 [Elsinoe batatas]|uniref:EthD domain-containing protein n=1 Tax=Elsinoe batatas TaxID=2601811 RepID=A0A8K0PGV6_9PEZI|nr:hypothetical protein KVT40_003236 [Elsinoe batatas]
MPTHDATHWTHESRDDYIFQLLHPRSAEGKFDFDYFFNVHLQKTNDVFKPASLIQTLITKADPTTDFLVVATFIFSDEKRFRKAMDSPEGQVLFADVASFSPATPTVVSGVVVREH